MTLPPVIEEKYDQLLKACNTYRVSKLYAFGSVVTDDFNHENSDLDFIAEMESMPPADRGENLINLWDELETIYNKKVDLLTDQPIKNPYLLKSIEESKQLIYDRASEKVPI